MSLNTPSFLFIILILIVGTTFSGCQSDPVSSTPPPQEVPGKGIQTEESVSKKKSGQLFSNFYIRFLEQENELKAEATFTRGISPGTAKPTDEVFEIKLNKMPFAAKTYKNITRFSLLRKSKFPGLFTIDFKEPDGTVHKTVYEFKPITEFYTKEQLKTSNGFNLNWKPRALEKGESIVVFITDAKEKAFTKTFEGPLSTSKISVPASDIEGISTGKAKIYLVYKKLSPYGTNRELIAFEFYSKSKTVEFIP